MVEALSGVSLRSVGNIVPMRRTFTPGRTRTAASATAVIVGLLLSACTVDDASSSGPGETSPAGTPAPDAVDPATLGLSVGDCVADLGNRGGGSGGVSGAADDAGATTTAEAAGAGRTSAAVTTTSRATATTTSRTAADDIATDATTDTATDTATDTDDGAGTSGPDAPDAGLDDTVPDSATGVTRISCDEPHVGEVYAQQDLDNEVLFPGARMPQFTAAVCTGDAFSDYIGYPFDSSVFDVITYAPSKESWAAGDRTVTCVVTDPAAGYIPGTLEGAGY